MLTQGPDDLVVIYMSYGGLDIASDSTDAARTGADTFPSFGISAYYNYYWNEEFSSTVGCLMTDLDTTDGWRKRI